MTKQDLCFESEPQDGPRCKVCKREFAAGDRRWVVAAKEPITMCDPCWKRAIGPDAVVEEWFRFSTATEASE